MDMTSLYYFSEVAKDLHITQTANRLYISQQTLSNHIMRMEEYYGVKLLNRKPKLSLTYAGEVVLAFANTITREHANLKDILADIQHEERGLLRFGASTLRMSGCLPAILPKFSARYPNIEIRITDMRSLELEQLILNGDLDLAIVLSDIKNAVLTSYPLMSDQIYLCVSDSLLKKYYKQKTEKLKKVALSGAYIEEFSELPFCMLSNRLGKRIQQCFDDAKIKPKVYATSTYMGISTSIGLKGTAACFTTQTNLFNQQGLLPRDINIFPLYYKNRPFTQDLVLIHHKDRYLTHYTKYFLELISEYFFEMEQFPMEHLSI